MPGNLATTTQFLKLYGHVNPTPSGWHSRGHRGASGRVLGVSGGFTMARIDRLPSTAIIDGFKGTLDFYMYKDTAVVRKWPSWTKREPHPDEKVNQDAFAYINKLAASLPSYIQDQYRTMAAGTPFTWKDLLVRAYMKGLDY